LDHFPKPLDKLLEKRIMNIHREWGTGNTSSQKAPPVWRSLDSRWASNTALLQSKIFFSRWTCCNR